MLVSGFILDSSLIGTARNMAVAMTSSDLGADRRVLAAVGTDCVRVGAGGLEKKAKEGTKELILAIQEAHSGGRAKVMLMEVVRRGWKLDFF